MFGFIPRYFGNHVIYKQHTHTHIEQIFKRIWTLTFGDGTKHQHLERSVHLAEQITLAEIHLLIARFQRVYLLWFADVVCVDLIVICLLDVVVVFFVVVVFASFFSYSERISRVHAPLMRISRRTIPNQPSVFFLSFISMLFYRLFMCVLFLFESGRSFNGQTKRNINKYHQNKCARTHEAQDKDAISTTTTTTTTMTSSTTEQQKNGFCIDAQILIVALTIASIMKIFITIILFRGSV